MNKTLKVHSPGDYSAYLGQTDRHRLVSVIDYEAASTIHHSLVYGIFLRDDASVDLQYGCGRCDYK